MAQRAPWRGTFRWSWQDRRLLLGAFAAAPEQLAAAIHGGSPAAGCLATLAAIGVQHPPRALASGLVVNLDELAVQGQVVTDGVLTSLGLHFLRCKMWTPNCQGGLTK